MTKKASSLAAKQLRKDIVLRHVEGVDLNYQDAYASAANDGYDPSIQTFRKDVADLGLRDLFRDGRKDGLGRPLLKSTIFVREWLLGNMRRIYESEGAVNVRHVYYVVMNAATGFFLKGEFEKGNSTSERVGKALAGLRREGLVPYEWIVDKGRRAELNTIVEINVADAIKWRLNGDAPHIQRDPWTGNPERCEIWFEKDGLSHIFAEACVPKGVPLVSCHGMTSITLLRDAAKRIEYHNKKGRHVTIYYFGDLDKSGLDIVNNVDNDLANHADAEKLDWNFVHLGIHPAQVEEHGFLTHPRRKSEGEKKTPLWAPDGWDPETVCELDAASPSLLRSWAEDAIGNHLTEAALKENSKIEEKWRKEAVGVIDQIRSCCGDIIKRYGVDGD